MGTKTVTMTIPDHVWGRLASIAENKNVRVAEVISDALLRTIDGDHRIRPPRLVPDELADLGAAVSAAKRDGYRAPRRNRND